MAFWGQKLTLSHFMGYNLLCMTICIYSHTQAGFSLAHGGLPELAVAEYTELVLCKVFGPCVAELYAPYQFYLYGFAGQREITAPGSGIFFLLSGTKSYM